MTLVGYGIVYVVPEEGFPFDRILAEIKDPEERAEKSQGGKLEEGEFYKFDEDSFLDLLTEVTDGNVNPEVWIGNAGLVDTFYVILKSASETLEDCGPVVVDAEKLEAKTEKAAFDAFAGRVFPECTPAIYLINDPV